MKNNILKSLIFLGIAFVLYSCKSDLTPNQFNDNNINESDKTSLNLTVEVTPPLEHFDTAGTTVSVYKFTFTEQDDTDFIFDTTTGFREVRLWNVNGDVVEGAIDKATTKWYGKSLLIGVKFIPVIADAPYKIVFDLNNYIDFNNYKLKSLQSENANPIIKKPSIINYSIETGVGAEAATLSAAMTVPTFSSLVNAKYDIKITETTSPLGGNGAFKFSDPSGFVKDNVQVFDKAAPSVLIAKADSVTGFDGAIKTDGTADASITLNFKATPGHSYNLVMSKFKDLYNNGDYHLDDGAIRGTGFVYTYGGDDKGTLTYDLGILVPITHPGLTVSTTPPATFTAGSNNEYPLSFSETTAFGFKFEIAPGLKNTDIVVNDMTTGTAAPVSGAAVNTTTGLTGALPTTTKVVLNFTPEGDHSYNFVINQFSKFYPDGAERDPGRRAERRVPLCGR